MKRIIRNAIAFLVIIAVVFLALTSYNPPKFSLRCVTPSECVEQIAMAVGDEHGENIAVPLGRIIKEPNFGQNIAYYEMKITTPDSVWSSQPRSQGEAQAQQGAIKALIGALVDLLRLTVANIAPKDPGLVTVAIRMYFPDGSVSDTFAIIDKLEELPDNAPDEQWLGELSPPTPQSIVPYDQSSGENPAG